MKASKNEHNLRRGHRTEPEGWREGESWWVGGCSILERSAKENRVYKDEEIVTDKTKG